MGILVQIELLVALEWGLYYASIGTTDTLIGCSIAKLQYVLFHQNIVDKTCFMLPWS